MPYLGLLLIFIGAFIDWNAYANRNPVKYVQRVLSKPEEWAAIAKEMEGTWVTGTATKVTGTGSENRAKGENTGQNGRLSADQLVRLSWAPSHRLIPSAASALTALNAAYRAAFGVNLSITSSYRSYAAQVTLRQEKPDLAATPGKSNHGWGRAVDLGGGINKYGSAQHQWMVQNAGKFGFTQPADEAFRRREPWHWEYLG